MMTELRIEKTWQGQSFSRKNELNNTWRGGRKKKEKRKMKEWRD